MRLPRPSLLYRVSVLLLMLSLLLAACGAGAPAQPTSLSPQIAEGKQIFAIHCASCHSTVPDTVLIGPSLAGLAQRAGEAMAGLDAQAYVRQSILRPEAFLVEGYKDLMPGNFDTVLDEGQVEALSAYLLTLE